jgi:hypothetical protein
MQVISHEQERATPKPSGFHLWSGSMIDLPTQSVIIGGLELWEMKGNSFTTISEPRLAKRLEQLFKAQGRLDDAKLLSLRTPPLS